MTQNRYCKLFEFSNSGLPGKIPKGERILKSFCHSLPYFHIIVTTDVTAKRQSNHYVTYFYLAKKMMIDGHSIGLCIYPLQH